MGQARPTERFMIDMVDGTVRVSALHESLDDAWWDLAGQDDGSLPEHSLGRMRAMTSCSGGSKARESARVTAVIMFIQRICTGVMGSI